VFYHTVIFFLTVNPATVRVLFSGKFSWSWCSSLIRSRLYPTLSFRRLPSLFYSVIWAPFFWGGFLRARIIHLECVFFFLFHVLFFLLYLTG